MPTPPVPPNIQTLPQLLLEALPPPFPTASLDALTAALSSVTLKELETALQGKDGRQAVLSQLKSSGVERIGDRQKIANALAKADRLGTLKPYLDEATAVSSGLAGPNRRLEAGSRAREGLFSIIGLACVYTSGGLRGGRLPFCAH